MDTLAIILAAGADFAAVADGRARPEDIRPAFRIAAGLLYDAGESQTAATLDALAALIPAASVQGAQRRADRYARRDVTLARLARQVGYVHYADGRR